MTTFILHTKLATITLKTAFDSKYLAEAAGRRATGHGASSVWIETKITTPFQFARA